MRRARSKANACISRLICGVKLGFMGLGVQTGSSLAVRVLSLILPSRRVCVLNNHAKVPMPKWSCLWGR